MRDTWAAYKVNIATGRIECTLGGKHSSFKFGSGASFQWQHNVTVCPGTPFVTLFDDACCQVMGTPAGPSRGLVLKLDPATHSVPWLLNTPRGLRFDSEYMGNIEPLPGGNEFVGWGSQPYFSEYTASGRMLLDAVLRVRTSAIARPSRRGSGCRCTRRAVRRGGSTGGRSSTRAGMVPRRSPRGGCWPDPAATAWCPR